MAKFYFSGLMAVAIAAGTAGSAAAQQFDFYKVYEQMQEQIKGTANERLKLMDVNNDTYVTRDEYINSEIGKNNMRSRLMFEDIDVDNDGKFNAEDYYTTLSIRNYQLLVAIAKEEEQKAASGQGEVAEPSKDGVAKSEPAVTTPSDNTNKTTSKTKKSTKNKK